jgi:hypothetical protein
LVFVESGNERRKKRTGGMRMRQVGEAQVRERERKHYFLLEESGPSNSSK